ncbi:hypothetical protein ACEPAH_844 [Sanghuangporus vaninii]
MLPPALSPARSSSSSVPSMAIRQDDITDRKPRIRHSEAQLAALNELYDENEFPSLEERAALAENLGMDPKAVNAWFANKRSATKKKTRVASHPYNTPPPPLPSRLEDDFDDMSRNHSRLSTPFSNMEFQSVPTSDNDANHVDNRHVFEGDISAGAPRRMRIRPTPKQREELERLFEINTHPSREEREALGDRIGMRYQSVTNWFQNMRSVMKKRTEEPQETDYQSAQSVKRREYNVFDQSTASDNYPALPPAASHPSLSASIPTYLPASRSATPYGQEPQGQNNYGQLPPGHQRRQLNNSDTLTRPRRTRPDPYQLEALRKLFARNPNPSIEERGALALEIGMDIGKVTNWFRNLRQTARKRALKANNDDGDESMDYDDSAPVSRASTPMFPSAYSSSSVSVDGDVEHMDLDGPRYYGRTPHHLPHSDGGSEEDYEEAVTPPPAPRSNGRRRMDVGFLTGSNDDLPISHTSSKALMTGTSTPYVDPPSMEDALLLLSFSRRTVHW